MFKKKVCNDGKAILDSIQCSQSTQIGQMEFKQAASHILDIVYEVTMAVFLLLFARFSLICILHFKDTFKSSTIRSFMGKQKAKVAKPIPYT